MIGGLGFLVMAFLSLGHSGGSHRIGHQGGHALGHGHSTGPHHALHHSPNGQTIKLANQHAQTAIKGGDSALQRLGPSLLNVLSPLTIFTIALGTGATGILLENTLSGKLTIIAALAGGLLLNFAIVGPLMNLLAKFAAKPSDGLEGQVAAEAEALTGFDHTGKGLVRVQLDGQIVQILARLDAGELGSGVSIHKGDKLVILEVNSATNTCTVSRDLSL